MRRTIILIGSGVIILFACQVLNLPNKFLPLATQPVASVRPPWSSPKPTPSLSPTVTIVEIETPAATASQPLSVVFHPDNGLYVGDQVSLEVIAPNGHDLPNNQVQVVVQSPISITLPTAKFAPFGLGNRFEANLTWAWDTRGLSPGEYILDFSVQPSGAAWTETISLQPAEARPLDEAGARWTTDESDCCLVYYITHTASERDKDLLLDLLDEQAEDISRKMQAEFTSPVTVTFIPRVLGHGGFTAQEISVSYLDRNYTGGITEMILRHELSHLLDNQLGGDLRPTILVEGLAVYISGGHFKSEPLLSRAAVLIDSGQYIPFIDLVDNFYHAQHEIGYLEAGALVQYLVEKYGWQPFSSFYRDIHPSPNGGKQSDAMDIALQKHFDLTLAGLEQQFLSTLRGQKISPESTNDVRLTVDYYDALRRYQQMLDSSAYFLNAWILDGKEMRERGITADYLRHPDHIINLVLETMLQAVGDNLNHANYDEGEHLVSAVNQVLDAAARHSDSLFSASSLAEDYHTAVQMTLDMGYQSQRIQWAEERMQVWATQAGQQLREFIFIREGNKWKLAVE